VSISSKKGAVPMVSIVPKRCGRGGAGDSSDFPDAPLPFIPEKPVKQRLLVGTFSPCHR